MERHVCLFSMSFAPRLLFAPILLAAMGLGWGRVSDGKLCVYSSSVSSRRAGSPPEQMSQYVTLRQ